VINEVHADPDPLQGDANGDGQVDSSEDEFVEIVNNGEAVIDLSGWSLHDITGLRHAFTDGTLLPSGCAVIVFGGGSPTGSFGGSIVQAASRGALGLNNPGDTLTLLDPDASVMLFLAYGPEGGQDHSLTRSPDLTGPEPLVGHLTAPGSGGARFSPGTKVDGSAFPGCSRNEGP
jgi:hypothetical protein